MEVDSWLLVGGRAGLFCSMFYSFFCVNEKGRTRIFGKIFMWFFTIKPRKKHDLYIA